MHTWRLWSSMGNTCLVFICAIFCNVLITPGHCGLSSKWCPVILRNVWTSLGKGLPYHLQSPKLLSGNDLQLGECQVLTIVHIYIPGSAVWICQMTLNHRVSVIRWLTSWLMPSSHSLWFVYFQHKFSLLGKLWSFPYTSCWTIIPEIHLMLRARQGRAPRSGQDLPQIVRESCSMKCRPLKSFPIQNSENELCHFYLLSLSGIHRWDWWSFHFGFSRTVFSRYASVSQRGSWMVRWIGFWHSEIPQGQAEPEGTAILRIWSSQSIHAFCVI